MAEFVRLTQMYSQCRKNRKGTGRVKEIIKEGMFNVNQFHNWITGFKNDETTQPNTYVQQYEVMKLVNQK